MAKIELDGVKATSTFLPQVWVEKVAAQLHASSEILRPTPLSDEERERAAARRAARAEYVTALRASLERSTAPVVREVASLHSADDYGNCDGCDFGGWEAEPVAWPCRTSELLGTFLGLEVVP